MRGKDEQQLDVFSYISPEQRVPHDHPLRPLRVMTDEALRELQPRFNKLYAKTGRPSIAPEKLLRALLLQALYSVRSERMLMEQLDYNLLFRWFVGLNMDDSVWDVTVFTKNRERLLDGDIAEAFFQAVLQQARERSLLSDEHFTVDGTLLEAWASVKSYQRKDANSDVPPDDPGNATVPVFRCTLVELPPQTPRRTTSEDQRETDTPHHSPVTQRGYRTLLDQAQGKLEESNLFPSAAQNHPRPGHEQQSRAPRGLRSRARQ